MPTFKHPCPHCGKYIERDVAACPFCGRADPFAPARCPACRTPIEDLSWVACPKCGALLKIPAGSVGKRLKCSGCAHVFEPPGAKPPAPPPAPPPPSGHAELTFDVTIANELTKHRINVNAIDPGWIETPGEHETFGADAIAREGAKLPWGRIGTPADIGKAVVFLCSDDADYVTGTKLVVDGGFTLPRHHE